MRRFARECVDRMVPTAPWSKVQAGLPQTGRPLLACYSDDVVTVFAAHRREIADFALASGRFGGDSWHAGRTTRFGLSFGDIFHHIKGGSDVNEERILAIHLRRDMFDGMLRQVVHWRVFPAGLFQTKAQWRLATRYAQAVMDWRPERGPKGADLERACVRFGVRGHLQKSFNSEWILGVEHMDPLHSLWRSGAAPLTPVVRPYPVPDPCRTTLSWDPEACHVS